jgi:DNA-binding transcriptional LysR family regulator
MGVGMQLSERVSRRIKLQDLNVFMRVVEAGAMSKAARNLNITQPAVSRAIAELEHVLGVRLLDRHREGVVPTDYGRALTNCGAVVFDGLRQGAREIEFLSDPTAGELRIGSIVPLAAGFVSAVVDRVTQRFPRMTFDMITGSTAELQEELRGRNVDLLVLRRFGPMQDEHLEFEFLFDDTFIVAASMSHRLARRRQLTLAELMDEPWILLPEDTVAGAVASEAFRASGLRRPKATVVTVSPEVRFSLLATGRFVTILSTSALRFPSRRRELKILPVQLPVPAVPNGLVRLKTRTLSPAANLFIEHARELARSSVSGTRRGGQSAK